MSISLLSEKEGNQDEIERSFERWREHEERWRVSRREREEKESVEERDCDNIIRNGYTRLNKSHISTGFILGVLGNDDDTDR